MITYIGMNAVLGYHSAMVFSHVHTNQIRHLYCFEFSKMDLESPGFELGIFRFQTQCSATEPTRHIFFVFGALVSTLRPRPKKSIETGNFASQNV